MELPQHQRREKKEERRKKRRQKREERRETRDERRETETRDERREKEEQVILLHVPHPLIDLQTLLANDSCDFLYKMPLAVKISPKG